MHRCVLHTTIILLFLTTPTLAESITDSAHHFSFDIPSNWHVMVGDDLARIKAASAPNNFVAGARVNGGNMPFCAVQILAEQIKDPAGDVATFRQGLEATPGLSVDSVVFDSRLHAYVSDLHVDKPTGVIRSVDYSFVGKDEVIAIHCFSSDADFAAARPMFNAMAESFRLEQDHGRGPALANSTLVVLAIVSIGLMLFFLRRVFRSL